MNNRSLVNLKQINPITGQSLVFLNMPIRLETMRILGWHTYCRVHIALMVLSIKHQEAQGQSARAKLEGLRNVYKSRHTPPKGWRK